MSGIESDAAGDFDAVVIGAGVVGLAIAARLAREGRETLVLEAENIYGSGVSSRNSEVIHAGIYYPRGSLKARMCVEGRQALYTFCESHGVAHRRCGKLIVAGPGELDELRAIERAGLANGVADLRWLDRAEALALEPRLDCAAALLSPSTGIVDSHGLMTALLGEAQHHGAMLAVGSRVVGGRITRRGVSLDVAAMGETTRIEARTVVNAAGLGAQQVARGIAGIPADAIPRERFAKGSYVALAGRSPFTRLVYPVPEPGGLGVHLTLDLGGQAKFGPNVEWVDAPDFDVDASCIPAFRASVARYWPGIVDAELQPGYAGVRPKLSGPGEPAADFHIAGPADHGVPGLVQLFGIESPGLTSSLAIAELVASKLAPPP
ncbi:NAD(P)/FAD-dependent oxidoreductase [Ramlibacter sp.]|uniref:NAD(P)/FAD-dependent oxidoreductase n=1 Tax=Ramlibacter sp. TaxID=1917967 RepID=UPI003D12D90A